MLLRLPDNVTWRLLCPDSDRERERERAHKLQDVTWRLLCPGSDRERKRERARAHISRMLHCDYRTMSHGDYCVRIQIERERAHKLQDVTWRLLCPVSDRERKRERERTHK